MDAQRQRITDSQEAAEKRRIANDAAQLASPSSRARQESKALFKAAKDACVEQDARDLNLCVRETMVAMKARAPPSGGD